MCFRPTSPRRSCGTSTSGPKGDDRIADRVRGELDIDRLADLESRYEVGKRRGAALAIPLLLWIGLAALVSFGSRGRDSRALQLFLPRHPFCCRSLPPDRDAQSPTLAIEGRSRPCRS